MVKCSISCYDIYSPFFALRNIIWLSVLMKSCQMPQCQLPNETRFTSYNRLQVMSTQAAARDAVESVQSLRGTQHILMTSVDTLGDADPTVPSDADSSSDYISAWPHPDGADSNRSQDQNRHTRGHGDTGMGVAINAGLVIPCELTRQSRGLKDCKQIDKR